MTLLRRPVLLRPHLLLYQFRERPASKVKMAKFQRYVWIDAAGRRQRNRAKYEQERKEMEKRIAEEKR
ncbi:hypothetical protein ANCDUO_10533 [Ancylostoma duodenale]|uniref:Uncharacterized protein n=1 Tax=Ancylostoma duodenale TaxID=51022 RepID=A0A0C2GQH1_9BILA|nr:hypothetical protein ANCDUO_10533 [Ancylostoma duodenale]